MFQFQRQGRHPFTQVPVFLLDAVAEGRLQAMAYVLWAAIERRTWENMGDGTISRRELAAMIGLTKADSVDKHVAALVEVGGLIVLEQRDVRGGVAASLYELVHSPEPDADLPRRRGTPPRSTGVPLPPSTGEPSLPVDLLVDVRSSGPSEPLLVVPEAADDLVNAYRAERAVATGNRPYTGPISKASRAGARELVAGGVDVDRFRLVIRWALTAALRADGTRDTWWLDHAAGVETFARRWEDVTARYDAAQRAAAAAEQRPVPSQGEHERMLAALGWSAWDWETSDERERAAARQRALENGWRPATPAGAPKPAVG